MGWWDAIGLAVLLGAAARLAYVRGYYVAQRDARLNSREDWR